MNFDAISQSVISLVREHSWIMQVFLIVLATLVVNYIERRIYKKLHPKNACD